jgi:hypothetical protein
MSEEKEKNDQLKVIMGVDKDTNNIIIGFNQDVSWIGMTPQETITFANNLIDRANSILNAENNPIEIS